MIVKFPPIHKFLLSIFLFALSPPPFRSLVSILNSKKWKGSSCPLGELDPVTSYSLWTVSSFSWISLSFCTGSNYQLRAPSVIYIYIYIRKVSSYYIGVSPGYLVPLIKFSCIARYSKVIKRRGSIFGIVPAIVRSFQLDNVQIKYIYICKIERFYELILNTK